MQAPARVAVVWSKISMAEAVPVTLEVAVAVRMTLSPERRDVRSAVSASVAAGVAAGWSVDCGTLGITRVRWPEALEAATGEAAEGSVLSSHAAGVLRSDFAGSAGHCASPPGKEG
jgi:hypothetical protein